MYFPENIMIPFFNLVLKGLQQIKEFLYHLLYYII